MTITVYDLRNKSFSHGNLDYKVYVVMADGKEPKVYSSYFRINAIRVLKDLGHDVTEIDIYTKRDAKKALGKDLFDKIYNPR